MTRTGSPTNSKKLNLNDVETPLLNRATQGQYPPGSTFKVVTAAAGLDSGAITPETTIDAPGTLIDEGHVLANDFNQDWGADRLDTALTNSVNTWFGQLGQKVGQDTLFETWKSSASTRRRRSTCPKHDEVAASGVYDENRRLLHSAAIPSTWPGSRSARSGCWRRRCRWRWSPPPSPTAAS